MEKAMYVFAGILLGAVVLAALSRVYPEVGVALLDNDGKRAAARAVGAGTPTQTTQAGPSGPMNTGGGSSDAKGLITGDVAADIPPSMLRLLPRLQIVGI